MKIFEFQFNPRSKSDHLFGSFCYEPGGIQEKKLGSLYIVAELKNALPQNSRLIQDLALLLKREYCLGSAPESAFKKALKKANEFLSERSKSGNVSWLGNLSVAVLNFRAPSLELSFSKDGKIKILLLRPGQIINIGRDFEIEEFEPYPLKIFTKISSGRFLGNDKILVLTPEVFEMFSQKGLLEKIAQTSAESEIKQLFKAEEKDLGQLTGLCLLLVLTQETGPLTGLTFKKAVPPLSLFKFHFDLRLPEVKIVFAGQRRKNLFLIFGLIFALLTGFFLAQGEKTKQALARRERLISLQEKTIKARAFLTLGQEPKANSLFREVFEELSSPSKESDAIAQEATRLKTIIEKDLWKLNKIEEIEKPKLIFDFAKEGFTPQRFVFFAGSLYFFSPYEKTLARLSSQGLAKIPAESGFNLAAAEENSLFLFAQPDKITVFKKENPLAPSLTLPLPLPRAETSFVGLSSFKENLYFLEKNSGAVIKYSRPGAGEKLVFQNWILTSEKRAPGARSLEVSGFVYLLAADNTIWEYRSGRFSQSFALDIFPRPKKLVKILGSPVSPIFALLEPIQGRIVLVDKQGRLIKQLKNNDFLNLKDAAFSTDGRSLYLLSGLKVYEIGVK